MEIRPPIASLANLHLFNSLLNHKNVELYKLQKFREFLQK